MMINGIGNNSMLQPMMDSSLSTANSKVQALKTDNFKKALENAKAKEDDKGLREACREFEELFINMMMKSMRKTVGDSGLTENSFARNTYQEMLDNEMAKISSQGAGIGIAQSMYDQLKGTV